jgi:hypothetical protein
MRNVLYVLFSLLIASSALAAPGSPTLWEKCVYGSKPGCQPLNIEGFTTSITTTERTVWPENINYVVPVAAASTPSCVSADANDDATPASNTGAQTIRVSGIKTTYAAFTETVSLNGTSAVNLATTNVLLINKLEVLTAGSGLVNAGAITCSNATGPVVMASMPAGANVSLGAIYGVPAGYTLLCKDTVLHSYAVTAGQTVQFLLTRYVNLGIAKVETLGYVGLAASNFFVLPNYLVFEEKTIFKVGVLSAASTGTQGVKLTCLLIEDAWAATAQDIF